MADAFAAESSATDHAHHAGRGGAGRGAPSRGQDGRLTRLGRLTRRSLRRFDRYTLDVFNAGWHRAALTHPTEVSSTSSCAGAGNQRATSHSAAE